MNDVNDSKEKRLLLESWFALYQERYAVKFVGRGEKVDSKEVLSAIGALDLGDPSKQYIYTLLAQIDGWVSVYIGKAIDPVERWKQHLKGFHRGTSVYVRWRERLLLADSSSLYDLALLVVPISVVGSPPIPGFPITAGSIEYQLVALASDAYPGMLLNFEGNRR